MTPRWSPSRRRFLSISAAAAALGLLHQSSAFRQGESETWHGTVLGARASIQLHHPDRAFARKLIRRARFEIERLEQVFSLYRRDSAVSRLNRQGFLDQPPLDLVRLLADARHYSELTDGAFDITVQPLWELYAQHFGSIGDAAKGPGQDRVVEVLARVDHKAVLNDPACITFEKPYMAITLNGIAQGYITDRVAEMFRREGLSDVLIDLGELRALGRHAAGRPWSVGLEDPRDQTRMLDAFKLNDAAMATSAGHGTRFDAGGEHHHLFEPSTGRSP